jgi:tetratricopeptide (TPR) repeat protein
VIRITLWSPDAAGGRVGCESLRGDRGSGQKARKARSRRSLEKREGWGTDAVVGHHHSAPYFASSLQALQALHYPLGLAVMSLMGSSRQYGGIFVHRMWAMLGLVVAAGPMTCLPAWAESCSGPARLEAEVAAHPSAGAFATLGNWFNENHQSNCAVESFEAGLKIDPASINALDGLAKALISMKDYETAISRLRSAPRDQNLILDLALAYRKAQLFDQAAQALTEGLKSYPNSVSLTGALVSLYAHESHNATARELAEDLAHRNPKDIEAQRIYFRTLVVTGDNDAAIEVGRKLLELAPHDADFLNLNGFLERKAGDYDAARKHLEEAVAESPNDYNPRVNLGLVLVELHDAAGARKQLEKAIELGASSAQVHFELAKVLRTLGQTEEAQRQLSLYQKTLKEESDQSLAVLKATEAAEAAKAGDNRKAADLYREACAAEPNDAALPYRLALVLRDLGDQAGERAALEQAIAVDPGLFPAQYALGYLEFQAGDNAGAERQFRLTIKAAPRNAQAWLSLAATLGAESRIPEAQEAVANALRLDPSNPGALDLSRGLAAAGNQH